MNNTVYLSMVTLFAGIGIPIMASLNSELGLRLKSAPLAACILFSVAFFVSVLVVLMQKPNLNIGGVNLPIVYYFGGLFVAFYVLSITWVAPKLGVSNAIFIILLGQIIAAVTIEHFAFLGAESIPLTPQRMLGVILMVAGIFLSRKQW